MANIKRFEKEEYREVVVKLRDCKAGEQIFATYSCPVYAFLCSETGYNRHCEDKRNPIVSDDHESPDDFHDVFTVTSDGDRYLVVEPEDEDSTLPEVSVERRPIDPLVWNETNVDNKIARKLPTPYEAPMASTIGYWERKAEFDFPPLWACHICRRFLTRDEARCALVSIVGELPRVDYVIPICQHCHDTANGKTFVAMKDILVKAPKV